MITGECPVETEVLSAVLAGRWPDACSEELSRHALACQTCGEVATVASALRDERELLRYDVQVPAAGQVWWRATVRARLEGAEAAARPMTWSHGIAAACAAGFAVASAGMAWPTFVRALGWLEARAGQLTPPMVDASDVLVSAIQQSLPLAVAAAVGIVITPIALYLALSDE
jgi:hypothetical protein